MDVMGGLTLRNRSAEISSKANNPKLEIDFRATCSASQLNPSLYEPPLMKACQDYLNACQQGTSLYNIRKSDWTTELIIYNTETETQEVKILQTPELDRFTCITQLPNGKLFCFGNWKRSGVTVLLIEMVESKCYHLELLVDYHHASISTKASIALEDLMQAL